MSYYGQNIKLTRPISNVVSKVSNTKRYRRLENKLPENRIVDNVPTIGYSVVRTSSKGVRLMTPYGVDVMISHGSFDRLVEHSNIVDTIIDSPCIWFTNNDDLKVDIMSINDPVFITYQRNTERIKNRVKPTDYKVGEYVTTQSGEAGFYLGKYNLITSSNFSKSQGLAPRIAHSHHFILTDHGIFHNRTPNILESDSNNTISDAEIKQVIEEFNLVSNSSPKKITFSVGGFPHSSIPYLSSNLRKICDHPVGNVKMTLDEISLDEAKQIKEIEYMYQDPGMLVLEKNDKFFIIEIAFATGFKSIVDQLKVDTFTTRQVLKPAKEFTEFTCISPRRNYFHRLASDDGNHTLEDFDRYYKVVKTNKNITYI